MLTVAGIYAPGQDLGKVIADLVADEHVPHLAALRYKDVRAAPSGPTGSRCGTCNGPRTRCPTRRRSGSSASRSRCRRSTPRRTSPRPATGSIAASSTCRRNASSRTRGASRDGDPSLLVGWAGWDHREQAQALATLIVAREQEDGWAADRLLPLVAGLREILPWVRQWHGEFDPEWGSSPADIYAGFLAETTNRLHLTDEALTSWRPPKATRGRKAKQ